MKTKLLLLAGLALAAASCQPLSDLDVRWTIDGKTPGTDAGLCAAYGIANWEVEIDGPDRLKTRIPCNEPWDTGYAFWNILDGDYDIYLEAVDASGKRLFQNVWTAEPVYGFAKVSHNFPGSGTADALIELYWNINGTTDGTAQGKSWDTCAEVGAAKAKVTVDGKAMTFDCHASGNMAGSVNVAAGDHSVGIKLIDDKGQDLTTEVKVTVKATGKTSTTKGTFTADFFFNSFLQGKNTSTKGTYQFATSWGSAKASCDGTTPKVAHTIVKLTDKSNNLVSGAKVTGPDSKSYTADGATTGGCYAKTQTLKIADQTWGLYGLRVQGSTDAATKFTVCWEKTKDYADYKDPGTGNWVDYVLVGAGAANPVRALNIPKTITTGACQ